MKQGCYSQRRHVLLIDLRDTCIYTLFMHKQPQFPQFFSVFSRTVCPILVIFSVRRDKKGYVSRSMRETWYASILTETWLKHVNANVSNS